MPAHHQRHIGQYILILYIYHTIPCTLNEPPCTTYYLHSISLHFSLLFYLWGTYSIFSWVRQKYRYHHTYTYLLYIPAMIRNERIVMFSYPDPLYFTWQWEVNKEAQCPARTDGMYPRKKKEGGLTTSVSAGHIHINRIWICDTHLSTWTPRGRKKKA